MSEWPLKAPKTPRTVLQYDDLTTNVIKGFLFSTAQAYAGALFLPVTVFWMDGDTLLKVFTVWGRDPVEGGLIHTSGIQFKERTGAYDGHRSSSEGL